VRSFVHNNLHCTCAQIIAATPSNTWFMLNFHFAFSLPKQNCRILSLPDITFMSESVDGRYKVIRTGLFGCGQVPVSDIFDFANFVSESADRICPSNFVRENFYSVPLPNLYLLGTWPYLVTRCLPFRWTILRELKRKSWFNRFKNIIRSRHPPTWCGRISSTHYYF
jgi:hypothetical protein